MTKYYYTCPIKAAYMAKEFGIIIGMIVGSSEIIRCSKDWENVVNYRCGNMYVAPESKHIFEPEAGDIFSYKMFGKVATYILPENQDGKEWVKEANEIQIIMRAGKQFFMPEVEKELEQEKTMQLHASSGKFGQEKEIINN